MLKVKIRALYILQLAVFFSSCTLLKPIVYTPDDADAAFEAGRYEEALQAYQLYVAAQQERAANIEEQVFYRAGISAFFLKDADQSITYLEKVRHADIADEALYRALAWAYQSIDNLSREISMLEHYVNHFPESDHFEQLQDRYFACLIESRNYDQALHLWTELEERASANEYLLNEFFKLQMVLGDRAIITATAKQLLQLNARHISALNWLAMKHLQQADMLYKETTQAYEQNRTHRQYAQLLQDFEVINTDLHIALNYFLQLYETTSDAAYAAYLANIYERFGDEEKTRYYRHRAGE
jgi:hypothetical protein